MRRRAEDVVRDLGCADDRAVGALDRRHRERDLQPGAAFVDAHRLVALDPFAPTDAREDVGLLVVAFRRNDLEDRCADHLLCGEAEQPLGSRIPGGHDPIERLADDRVFERT